MSHKNIRTEVFDCKDSKEDLTKYEFIKTIGQGNFGKVKLAIYIPSNEQVAIKILNKETIESKNEMNLVKRELNIIKSFSHINVIKVISIIEDAINYYIIMEYCQQGELFDYIVKHQKLSEKESSLFFYQLINAVDYIHSHNIVHRDLKPENLLLNKEKILKIIDFGLSNTFDGSHLLSTKCGSPSYAAPEIIKESHYNGFKTDIWCCGIILYAMLCGYLPFDGEENKELFSNILSNKIDYPEHISDEGKSIIKRMLTSEPDKRITIEEIKNTKYYLKGKELFEKEYKDILYKKEKKKVKPLRIINSNSEITINHKKTVSTRMNGILQTEDFKKKDSLSKLLSFVSPKNKKKNLMINTNIFSKGSNMNKIHLDNKVYRFKPKFSLRQLIEIKNKKCEIPLKTQIQNTTVHVHHNSVQILEKPKRGKFNPKNYYNVISTEPKEKKSFSKSNRIVDITNRNIKTVLLSSREGNNIPISTGRKKKSVYNAHTFKTSSALPKLYYI